jgi:hypothetical protein
VFQDGPRLHKPSCRLLATSSRRAGAKDCH